jgi:hypothetical protein
VRRGAPARGGARGERIRGEEEKRKGEEKKEKKKKKGGEKTRGGKNKRGGEKGEEKKNKMRGSEKGKNAGEGEAVLPNVFSKQLELHQRSHSTEALFKEPKPCQTGP